MVVDEFRERYLRDRVLTATPAQRVVLLYDRLGLDLTLADSDDRDTVSTHAGHALQIVAELRSSLDIGAGEPAENLASIYSFLLGELVRIQSGETARLSAVRPIVTSLRDTWAQAAEQLAGAAPSAAAGAHGGWVG